MNYRKAHSLKKEYFRWALIACLLLFYPLALFSQSGHQQKDRPNVLFIAIDDLNDWTGFLGGHPQAKTPQLDKLAEKAVVFTSAYCTSPACGPSRTSLMYGIQTHKSGSYGHHAIYNPNNLPAFENKKTIPEVFGENGYYTAGCGKIYHYYEDNSHFEVFMKQKNPRIFPDPNNPESYIPKAERPYSDFKIGPVRKEDENKLHDKQYADWAIEELKKDHDKPFFLAIGFEKPHLPWVAPQEYFDMFDQDEIELPAILENDLEDVPEVGRSFAHDIFGFFDMDPTDHEFIVNQPGMWQKMIKAYLACSAHTDAMIGKVLNALEKSRYSENTIVVLWSDHGWHLGEKEHWRKMSLWANGSRMPFIIQLPGQSEGLYVNKPVSLQDIYPTLIELCRLKTEQEPDGNSLTPLLKNRLKNWNKPVLVSHGPGNFAVCLDHWRYIQYHDGTAELYNLEDDPHEFQNLVNNPKHKKIVSKLKKHVPTEFKTVLGPRFEQFYEDNTN